MANSLACVVIPYSRFLECQERRRGIAAELTQGDRSRTIDADVVFVPAKTAFPQTLTSHDDGIEAHTGNRADESKEGRP